MPILFSGHSNDLIKEPPNFVASVHVLVPARTTEYERKQRSVGRAFVVTLFPRILPSHASWRSFGRLRTPSRV